MRALFLLLGLFVVHCLLAQVYPPYRQRLREFDHKLTWMTLILVLYVVGNVVYIVFFR
jgi:predicted membrane channel-forming protein YqfA (hemolysin III family)